MGTAAAADVVLAEATGEYAVLLDAATRTAPGTLKRLTEALERHHDALWAAPRTPGLAVLRRRAFLALGGFDPDLRGAEAVGDLAHRASAAGWRLVTVGDAAAHRDGRPGPTPWRPALAAGRRAARAHRPPPRPWSGEALARWLPRVRRTVRREDLA
jgi:GT2 family glycosyltransferase